MRIEVERPNDPAVTVFLGLRDHASRQRAERPGGRHSGTFIAEGDVVIERGLHAGYQLRSVLVSAKRTKPLPELPADAVLLAASDAVLEEITGRPALRDPLACFIRPEPSDVTTLVETSSTVALLEGINNPNNLGVIMRNAAGLGIDSVLLDETCGDPLYRRAIRASMGQVFTIPFARAGSGPEALERLRTAGFQTVALTPSAHDELHTVPLDAKVAICLGAEGPGLTDALLAGASHRVRIAMDNAVDSLNVANAAAIAFHHVRTRR